MDYRDISPVTISYASISQFRKILKKPFADFYATGAIANKKKNELSVHPCCITTRDFNNICVGIFFSYSGESFTDDF